MCPKEVNIASPKRGKITGVGEIISDEGETRARGRIGCDAFGDRRIDRSITDDHVKVSLSQAITMPWPISRLFVTKC